MDKRTAAANGAAEPRLLSASGRCSAARHTRPGRPATFRLNDAMSCGRPTTFAVRLHPPANKADGAARTSAFDDVESLGCPAAHPHRSAKDLSWTPLWKN